MSGFGFAIVVVNVEATLSWIVVWKGTKTERPNAVHKCCWRRAALASAEDALELCCNDTYARPSIAGTGKKTSKGVTGFETMTLGTEHR